MSAAVSMNKKLTNLPQPLHPPYLTDLNPLMSQPLLFGPYQSRIVSCRRVGRRY